MSADATKPRQDIATHTPTPWSIFEHADHSGLEIGPPYPDSILNGALKGNVQDICGIRAAKDTYPCKCSSKQKADAEFIVRAVNNFDSLLEACKLALSGTTNPLIEPVLQEAIRKAESR